jgi:hypothetical protein
MWFCGGWRLRKVGRAHGPASPARHLTEIWNSSIVWNASRVWIISQMTRTGSSMHNRGLCYPGRRRSRNQTARRENSTSWSWSFENSWSSIVCICLSSAFYSLCLRLTAQIVRVVSQQRWSKSLLDQALYFHKEALALRSPHKKILGDLREWMRRPTMGHVQILSWDWRTWEVCDEDDLITFENSTMDRFTSLVTYTIVDMYHNLIGRHIHVRRLRPLVHPGISFFSPPQQLTRGAGRQAKDSSPAELCRPPPHGHLYA